MKTVLLIAVVLATSVAGPGSASAATHRTKTVSTATSKLGRILVDDRGRTLYLFERDPVGRTTCTAACAGYWPPLLTRTKPTAGRKAKQSLLGVIRRSDGTRQVTYAGHPLYDFVGDAKPGQTTGQGLDQFGAEWYVLAPAGTKIAHSGA